MKPFVVQIMVLRKSEIAKNKNKNEWLKQFFKYYSQNYPVDECVEYAANSVGNDENGLKRQDILIAYRED